VPSISTPYPVNKFDRQMCKELKRPFIIFTLKIFRFSKKKNSNSRPLFSYLSCAFQELLRLLWNSKKGSSHCFEQPPAATAWTKVNPVSFRIISILG
jgi:hypothetical protein